MFKIICKIKKYLINHATLSNCPRLNKMAANLAWNDFVLGKSFTWGLRASSKPGPANNRSRTLPRSRCSCNLCPFCRRYPVFLSLDRSRPCATQYLSSHKWRAESSPSLSFQFDHCHLKIKILDC